MKSRALHDYLVSAGVVGGSDAEIALAKAQYRRLYKKRWKERSRPRKELRIEITLRQFAEIKAKAASANMRHTTFARAILLHSLGAPLPPLRDTLLRILQHVSMASIRIARNDADRMRATRLLEQAETALLEYLNQLP